jgi:hypothetical protein
MQSDVAFGLRTALVALALYFPVYAVADEQPAISIKTKTIEASITIDDGLKAYPSLAENLLAEGQRDMTKWRAEADKDRKEMPDIFREGRRYSHERSYTMRSVIGRYVSIVRADYFDGLGAHPNSITDTILWDSLAKKRISIRPFFKETSDAGPTLQGLAKAIRAALAVEKRARDLPLADPETDESLSAVKPKLLEIGAVALAPSTAAGKSAGLLFYFSPYAVGPYVEGAYVAFVPFAEFKDSLSAEGAALFAGERPKGDGDND